jgi:hypothetical protein
MSVRRLLVLMHGLGYEMPDQPDPVFSRDITSVPDPLERAASSSMSSRQDLKRFFGGAIHVTADDEPEGVTDG